jgi:hypothetical protein
LDKDTSLFREDYRRSLLPKGYHGIRHAALVIGAGAAMLIAAALQLTADDLLHYWWVIPVSLVVANIVEYLVHRHIMHKEVPGLRAMYERHTRRHHRYFTIGDPELTGQNDLHAVLFPPVLLLFFSAIAVLLSISIGLLLGRPVGVLFFLVALTYYLTYEALHLLSHWPLKGSPGKSALIHRVVSHHRLHHAPDLMRNANFNIFLPFADWLFRTLRRDTARVSHAAQDRSESPRVS